MLRKREPESMDDEAEVNAYAAANFRQVNAAFVERALAHLDDHATGNGSFAVLDAGCGPGEITIAVARARPAWHVVGVDISEPMLDIARVRASELGVTNVKFRIGDVKALARPGRLFDAIISNSLLHHLPNPDGFWRAIASVVRFGGPMFIRDLRRPEDEALAQEIVERHAGGESELLRAEFYRSLLAAFTVEEVRAQAEAAGLCAFQVDAVDDRYLDIHGGVA